VERLPHSLLKDNTMGPAGSSPHGFKLVKRFYELAVPWEDFLKKKKFPKPANAIVINAAISSSRVKSLLVMPD